MDPPVLPQTRPGVTGQPVQQQRPSLTYFLFLSLLFYLINTNNPPLPALPQSPSEQLSASAARALAQSRILTREARAEGLAQWTGEWRNETVESGEWLNSTLYPEVANGTAPREVVREVERNGTKVNETEMTAAWRIPAFSPSLAPELPPVVPLVQQLLSRAALSSSSKEGPVYPQNLTGFGKGTWEARRYGWDELGLNETWTEEEVVEVPLSPPATGATELQSNGTQMGDERRVERRQTLAAAGNSTTSSSSNVTTLLPPARNLTTITHTYNRTLQRGPFPWLSSLLSPSSPSSSQSKIEQKASLNLRSVQTTAVGPFVPLKDGLSELDDGELLEMREAKEEWEKEGVAVYLGGTIELKSQREDGKGEESETSLDLEAVHFLSSGRIYGYATPSHIPSHVYHAVSLPFSLSSSFPPSAERNRTAQAIGHAMLLKLRQRIAESAKELDESTRFLGEDESSSSSPSSGGSGEAGTPETFDKPECIFSFFGSLSPLPSSTFPTLSSYSESYASLFRPSGSSPPPLPPSSLSAVLSSSNCGLVLTLPSITLTSTQSLWVDALSFAVVFGVAQAAMLSVLVRQLERVQARPGTTGNVATAGVGAMCMMDAYVGVTLLTVGIVTYTRTSLPLLGAAFLGILSSALFGLRYFALIREAAPAPSPAAPSATTAVAAEEGAEVGEAAGGEGREVEEGVVERWRAGRARPGEVKIALLVPVVVFALYLLIFWGWWSLLLAILYSYWIPQILHNAWRGTARQSLSAEYVVVNTVGRLLLPLYFWEWEGNCLMVETSGWVYLLVLYSSLQASILLLQSRFSSSTSSPTSSFFTLSSSLRRSPLSRVLSGLPLPSLSYLPLPTTLSSSTPSFLPEFGTGARFFLPQSLIRALDLPTLSSWNYHPHVLPDSLLSDLLLPASPSNVESAPAGGEGSKYLEPDCPICLSPIPVVPSKADYVEGPAKVEEVRLGAAITPCKHVVHTECLEQWVGVRAVCPVCRSALPPLR
ncbi:hypothetical protein JCM8547_008281 [Rhodosporidiobolus lusitaniae]